MSQITYAQAPGQLSAGMKASIIEDDCISGRNGTVATIPFGHFVAFDANDDEVDLPAATTDLLAGVVVHDHHENSTVVNQTINLPFGATDTIVAGLLPGKRGSIMRKGAVWVDVASAVAKGQHPFVRVADGNLGSIRGDADAGDAVEVFGAHFLTSTAGAGKALLYLSGALDWITAFPAAE